MNAPFSLVTRANENIKDFLSVNRTHKHKRLHPLETPGYDGLEWKIEKCKIPFFLLVQSVSCLLVSLVRYCLLYQSWYWDTSVGLWTRLLLMETECFITRSLSAYLPTLLCAGYSVRLKKIFFNISHSECTRDQAQDHAYFVSLYFSDAIYEYLWWKHHK